MPSFDPQTMGTVAAIFSAIAAACAAYLAWFNANVQRKAEKKRFITVLWDKISVRQINPSEDKLVLSDLVKALNTLELLASSWYGDVVDKDLFYHLFYNAYVTLYKQISRIEYQIKAPADAYLNGRDGSDLLGNLAGVNGLYKELEAMRAKAQTPRSN